LQATPTDRYDHVIFGHPFRFETNDAALVTALRRSLPRYVQMPPRTDAMPLHIRLLVRPDWEASGPDLQHEIRAAAHEDWLSINFGRWGQSFADLQKRFALGLLSPALAAQTELVSRSLIDTYTLRMAYRDPTGILHATGLTQGDRAILLVGPHGVGKSTTSARFLRAGYRLLADSLVLCRWRADGLGLELFGYPSGELKLTPDTRPLFPELSGQGEEVISAGRRKWLVSLHAAAPALVSSYLPQVAEVIICLLRRSPDGRTRRHAIPADEAFPLLLPDTDYLEEVEVMARNLAVTEALVRRSRCYVAEIGADPAELVAVLSQA
jgi:hypothetical protein